MTLSLNENSKSAINEMFFNEGLVLLDKEMKVFLSNKTAEGKNTERKLQLVWDKISRDEKVGELVSALISLVKN